MAFLKSLPIIAMLLVAIFKDYLPKKIRSKSWLRNSIVILLLSAALVNIVIIASDDNQVSDMRIQNKELNNKVDSLVKISNSLQSSLNQQYTIITDLSLKLGPFVRLATNKYPRVAPDSALQRLHQELERVKTRTSEIVKRTNIISYFELRVELDETSSSNKSVSEKETSAGIQSAVALFDAKKNRYRFVTDFQFSYQQISPKYRKAFFVYHPEDPSQLLGKSLRVLNTIEAFGCNYSAFANPIGFSSSGVVNRITVAISVNGVQIPIFTSSELPANQLFSRQLEFNVSESFDHFDEKYSLALDKGVQ